MSGISATVTESKDVRIAMSESSLKSSFSSLRYYRFQYSQVIIQTSRGIKLNMWPVNGKDPYALKGSLIMMKWMHDWMLDMVVNQSWLIPLWMILKV